MSRYLVLEWCGDLGRRLRPWFSQQTPCVRSLESDHTVGMKGWNDQTVIRYIGEIRILIHQPADF